MKSDQISGAMEDNFKSNFSKRSHRVFIVVGKRIFAGNVGFKNIKQVASQ